MIELSRAGGRKSMVGHHKQRREASAVVGQNNEIPTCEICLGRCLEGVKPYRDWDRVCAACVRDLRRKVTR